MNPMHAESGSNSERDEIGDLAIEYESDDPVDNHTAEDAQCNNEGVLSPATPIQNRISEELVPNAPRKECDGATNLPKKDQKLRRI